MSRTRSSLLSLLVGGMFVYSWSACGITKQHDCKETPGYCAFNEYCDSDTRRCVLTCTALPPRACPSGSSCDYASGKCRPLCGVSKEASETSCTNGLDDDCNGKTDCAETVCEGKTCGSECLCRAGIRTETDCDNGKDDDFDGNLDCADDDCLDFTCLAARNTCQLPVKCDGINATCGAPRAAPDAGCGIGCACSGATPSEARCNDGVDNDSDGTLDCADLADCPDGTACRQAGGDAGICTAGACQ